MEIRCGWCAHRAYVRLTGTVECSMCHYAVPYDPFYPYDLLGLQELGTLCDGVHEAAHITEAARLDGLYPEEDEHATV
jgi:hypothetical protein